MKINEISKKYGISRKAILYYEQQGLIEVKRLDNNYRDFDQLAVCKLLEINNLRLLDVPVKVIDEYLIDENPQALDDYITVQKQTHEIAVENIKLLEQYQTTNQLPTNIDIIQYIKANIPYPAGIFIVKNFQYYLEKDNVKYEGNELIFDEIINYIDNQDWSTLVEFLSQDIYSDIDDKRIDIQPQIFKYISSLKALPEPDPDVLALMQEHAQALKQQLIAIGFETDLAPLIRKLSPSYNLMIEKMECLAMQNEE